MVSDGRFLQRNVDAAGNSSIRKLINGSLSGMNRKRKKMKSLMQVTMQSGKAEPYPEYVGAKRMRMNGHRYKAIFKEKRKQLMSGVKRKTMDAQNDMDKFKKKRITGTLSDVDDKLEAPDVPSPVGSGDGRAIDLEPEGENNDTGGELSGSIVEKMRVECVDKAFDGATEKCISSQKGSEVDPSEYGINAGHSVKDKPLEPAEAYGYEDRKSLVEAGILKKCSINSTELPESVSLTLLGRSLGDAIDHENGEKHVMDSKVDHTSMDASKDVRLGVADTAPSPLHEVENGNLLGLHVECTEERRTISMELDMDESEERIALSDKQWSSQQKQGQKDKVSGRETNDKIKKIQEKCEKWMKKLVQQQLEETQDFQRIWEEERVELENVYKLETAVIRCIYSQGFTRINKLKLLDEDMSKKIEEHKLLKDMNLEHLKAKQLAAQKDKRGKVAYLTDKAKACYRSQSVDNPCLLESQSVDFGQSRAIEHLTASDSRDVDSSSEQHNKEEIHDKIIGDVQGDNVLPSNTSVSVSAEAAGCAVPTVTVEIPLNKIPERTAHNETSSVVAAEQPRESNPPKTVNTAIEGHCCSVESPDAPLRVNNRVDLSFPENVSDQREAANGVQLLLRLEETVASADRCGLLPQCQVVEQDECHRCSMPEKLQDQDAPGPNDPCTISVEGASLEAIGAATTVQSNHEVIKNCEPLLAVSANVSEACNPAAVSEVERQPQDKAGSSSQIPEAFLHLTKVLEGPSVAHVDPTLDRQTSESAEAFSVQSNNQVIENCEKVNQVSDISPPCEQVSAGLVEHQTQDEVILHLTELEPVSNQANNQVNENCEKVNQVSDISPPCGQVSAGLIERHSQDEAIRITELEPVYSQATSQSGGNLELHPAVATVELSSLGCNQVSASEVERQAQDEARSSSQTAAASLDLTEELEAVEHQTQDDVILHLTELEPVSNQANNQVNENCKKVNQVSDISPPCGQVSAGLVERHTQDEAIHLTGLEPVSNQATSQSGGNLELHPAVATVELTSLGCNQVSACEVERQAQNEARSSSQTAAASLHLTDELEALPFQASSRSGEIVAQHPPAAHVISTPDSNHLRLGSENRIDSEPNGELNATSNMNFTMPSALTNTAELPNQACLQLGEDITHLQEPSNLLIYPSSTVGSLSPNPSCEAKSFENELHRLRKEREEVIKVHECEKSKLQFHCKEEIREITAQLHDKYCRKLQDAVVQYRLRKSELDNYYYKVLMNKILAQAFETECSIEHPATRQAMQDFCMQHLNNLRQTSARPSPEFTASQPTSSHHTAAPNVQTMHVSQSQSIRPSDFAGFSLPQLVQPAQRGVAYSYNVPNRTPHSGTFMPSFSQPVQHGVARPHNFPSRPLHIGTLIPNNFPSRPLHIPTSVPNTVNLRVNEATHSPAPHLQAFRPAPSTAVASFAGFPPIVSGQLASVIGPSNYSSFSQLPPFPRSDFQTPQPMFSNFVSHGLLAAPSTSQFTQELQMGMDDQLHVQGLPRDVVYLSD